MESEPSHGPTLRKNIRRHASDFPGKRQQWRSHAVFADCYLERLRGRNADRGRRRALRATKSTWRDYVGRERLRQCCRTRNQPVVKAPHPTTLFRITYWIRYRVRGAANNADGRQAET